MRGKVMPIFSNAFLEQMRNNLENMSDTKVLYVIKGCLKNLALAKNAMRAQNPKSRFLEQFILPSQLFEYDIPVPNQPFLVAQNRLNCNLFQYWTSKHDMHTYGTFRAGFADFFTSEITYYLLISNLFIYTSWFWFTLYELIKWKVCKKSFRMSYKDFGNFQLPKAKFGDQKKLHLQCNQGMWMTPGTFLWKNE